MVLLWKPRKAMKTRRKAMKKTAAIITIKSPGKMTPRGRKDIVTWMRKQAAHLHKYGKHYTDKRFTARFIYE